MKSILLLLIGVATPTLAGPGSSGGNPAMTIASPARDYLFSSAPPTAQVFSAQTDAFDFGLAGYKLDLAEIPYETAHCPAVNRVKTVCAERDATVIVLGKARKTFRLKFTDTGVGAARLKAISAEIVATFSQSSKQ